MERFLIEGNFLEKRFLIVRNGNVVRDLVFLYYFFVVGSGN